MLELFDSDLAPDNAPLFVYGTLRPGGRLFRQWIGPAVIDSEPAVAVGYALVTNGSFPLMVKRPGEIVYGDLLWVDRRNIALTATMMMELSAGYDIDMIYVEGDSVNLPIPAMSFIWNHDHAGLPAVPYNDWNAT